MTFLSKSGQRAEIMVASCTEMGSPNPVRLDLSRDLNHTVSFLRADKELGFTCLKSRWVLQDHFLQKGEPRRGGCRTPS